MVTDLLVKVILESPAESRRILIREYTSSAAEEVARSLQETCYEVWTDDPQKIGTIAEILDIIADHFQTPIIQGYAEWTNAIKELVAGGPGACIRFIDSSEASFLSAGQDHLAAKTQTSKLYALALLGRYDEAVECGKSALKVFLDHEDIYSAGKIEHNIGNLFWRRDKYLESEPFLESALERFLQIDDQRQMAMVENCQAFVKTLQNDFRGAEAIYNRSLERAVANNLTVTAAEIETGLSNLNLFKGDYEKALGFMESSRRKYEDLGMPMQSANCELEIADIYLELNLLSEAVSFYEKGEQCFSTLSGQAELARCNLGHARALERLGDKNGANIRLDIAEKLFEKEGNMVAVGSVRLVRSQQLIDSGDLDEAEQLVDQALFSFRNGGNPRSELFARWLKCEIWRAYGRTREAERELNEILPLANENSNEIYYLCLVSLGKVTRDDVHFRKAVEIVERSRSGLASAELRTSYFTEKLTPYEELIKISFNDQDLEAAFRWHERSRSRSMSDSVSDVRSGSHSNEKLRSIREELNWLYRRIDTLDADKAKKVELREAAEKLEGNYAESLRRLHASELANVPGKTDLDLDELRKRLGDATLLEFVAIDGKVSVFVISNTRFSVVQNYIGEAEMNAEISQYLFHLKTGRFIDRLSETNRAAAAERLLTHGRRLYDLIIKPIERHIDTGRAVIAPAGRMHYLPFHALFDGDRYVAERFTVSYTPSAAMLVKTLQDSPSEPGTALIAGIADALMPKAEIEVEAVSSFFEEPTQIIGSELTIDNLREEVVGKAVLHLACHGNFRPDNPAFSSLDLFGEKMTANDVSTLSLQGCIVILSSCEGGLNEVARGEELIGLTGAFFAAGASTLVQSLWRVNDDAALELMLGFYEALTSGLSASAALQKSQLDLIGKGKHPYLWAPFIVSGRW